MHSDKHLHIISFNIPYPPDNGGLIDVFYKIKALSEVGVKIHLHCFHYDGRKRHKVIEDLCFKVNYYKRKLYINPLITRVPYIVKTRRSEELLINLLQDNYPILFEGIHCTYYLNHPDLSQRTKVVRMHNIENLYYKNLARIEKKPLKKYYFNTESNKLKFYQKILSNANLIASISPADHNFLNLKFGNSFYLPVFHPNDKILGHPGKGDYMIYHGNLGIGENNEAALYLVKYIFNQIKYPAIIAGSNPSNELIKAINGNPNITLRSNIDTKEINNLIENAHINIIPTFQDTGIKLKLINALFRGRFCIVNSKMVKNTGLEDLCIISDNSDSMKDQIHLYFEKEYTNNDRMLREKYLNNAFSNRYNAKYLIQKIYL